MERLLGVADTLQQRRMMLLLYGDAEDDLAKNVSAPQAVASLAVMVGV